MLRGPEEIDSWKKLKSKISYQAPFNSFDNLRCGAPAVRHLLNMNVTYTILQIYCIIIEKNWKETAFDNWGIFVFYFLCLYIRYILYNFLSQAFLLWNLPPYQSVLFKQYLLTMNLKGLGHKIEFKFFDKNL